MKLGDYMKKQGFTLIELLAVIVLLGLILALVFPNILDQVQKRQKELDDSKLDLIYSGAKKYCIENDQTFPCKVKLDVLYNDNQIPFDIKDYKIGSNYGEYTCIIVEKTTNDQYSYNHSNEEC